MSDAPKPIEVFFAYAHEDEPLRKELEKHLSLLHRQGLITGWHDRLIAPGTDWTRAVDEHLEHASVILLLISADFLASDYCYGVEVQRALQRHLAQQACVLPVLLRPVNWKGAAFGHLQALPGDGKPITTWSNQDEAFANVAAGIYQAVEDFTHPDTPSSVMARTMLKSSVGHTVLGRTEITIGRAPDNVYVIDDPQVSWRHAVIRRCDRGHAIFDLESRNKTFVNGQALYPGRPRMLQLGDKISVGMTTFEYSDDVLVVPIPTLRPPPPVMPVPRSHVPSVRYRQHHF